MGYKNVQDKVLEEDCYNLGKTERYWHAKVPNYLGKDNLNPKEYQRISSQGNQDIVGIVVALKMNGFSASYSLFDLSISFL